MSPANRRSPLPAEGRAPTPQGEHSRQRLLDAATALISERGYAASSVGAVCQRAGVARTALYWHFESKEGLLAAVVERVGQTWIEEIQKSVYLSGEPLERLSVLLAGARRIVGEQPELLRLLLVVTLERASGSAPLREALLRVWKRAERALVEGIEDTAGRALPDLDLVAQSFLGLLQGALLRLELDPEADLDRVVGELGRVLLLSVADRA